MFKTYTIGEFIYDDLKFKMEPFYVGKGSGDRIKESTHHKSCTNLHKFNIIQKIHNNNLTVSSIKFKEDLTETEAFELERFLIEKIGRYDLGKGPLSNMTDGGEGQSGCKNGGRKKKPVLQYNLAGKLIREYGSITEATRKITKSDNKNINVSLIYIACIKKRRSFGFLWRFKNETSSNTIDVSYLKKLIHHGNKCRPVIQLDITGNYIQTFKSGKAAEEITGCRRSHIAAICSGVKHNGYTRKSTRDKNGISYKWKYAD